MPGDFLRGRYDQIAMGAFLTVEEKQQRVKQLRLFISTIDTTEWTEALRFIQIGRSPR